MNQERIVYLNGQFIPESKASISIHDLGFVLADAVYDSTRTFGGIIFKLDEHIDRFYRSLKYVRIDPGMTKREMAELTMQVLDANRHLLQEGDDYWVTQRVTRGVRTLDKYHQMKSNPTILIQCTPLPFQARAHYYRDGLPVVVPSIRRIPPECMSPRAKSQNYMNLVHGDLEVRAQNPDAWAIQLDMNGNLCEGIGSNIFVLREGVLRTPLERYVLPGISRKTVLELAQDLDIRTSEEDIDLFDAYNADEVFVTSTSFCICPVHSVNGVVIGSGEIPGPVTGRLFEAYSKLVGIDIAGQYLARL
ncbi:MAG: aminotransferase class IV [Anaerolineales bacterium]|nr:aminotransferase class IV [Anaerolineales bacterium]